MSLSLTRSHAPAYLRVSYVGTLPGLLARRSFEYRFHLARVLPYLYMVVLTSSTVVICDGCLLLSKIDTV
jgi:hypothetical protein